MVKDDEGKTTLTIPAIDFRTLDTQIVGTAPYMQCRFSEKAFNSIVETQKAGTTAKGKKNREAKDFDAAYEGALHVSTDGWYGIPAPAFRAAMIDVCRAVNFQMTKAKMSVFVEADGFDRVDGTPLVRIYGEPEKNTMPVRLPNGSFDARIRPMWREWTARVRVRYDAAQFTAQDVMNLLYRAGAQVGVGEGRPFSRNSAGMGLGTFSVERQDG